MFFLENIWVVPLLPLLGAATMFFFGRTWLSSSAHQVPAGAGHHDHDDAGGPSPADTHHDTHAAHGPADDHAHAEHAHPAPERLPKAFVNGVCVGVVVLAFLWSVGAVWQLSGYMAATHKTGFETTLYTWLGTDAGARRIGGHAVREMFTDE